MIKKLLCIFSLISCPVFGMHQKEAKKPVNFYFKQPVEIKLQSPAKNMFFCCENNLLLVELTSKKTVKIDLNHEFNIEEMTEQNSIKPDKQPTKKEFQEKQNSVSSSLKYTCFACGPNELLAICNANTIYIRSTKTKNQITTIKTGMKNIKLLSWSPDGMKIAAISEEKTETLLKIWQLMPC